MTKIPTDFHQKSISPKTCISEMIKGLMRTNTDNSLELLIFFFFSNMLKVFVYQKDGLVQIKAAKIYDQLIGIYLDSPSKTNTSQLHY